MTMGVRGKDTLCHSREGGNLAVCARRVFVGGLRAVYRAGPRVGGQLRGGRGSDRLCVHSSLGR